MTGSARALDIEPGTVVANRYRIGRPLGRGGMGEVFAAENIRTGRPVAVKLLRAESKAKSSAVMRFRREARAAGSINSDHVTEILDVEEDAEHGIVLVFELLEGESLIDRLKRTGPIPFDELHGIIEQAWLGLADAHKAGIIHRDLKPSNVFLEKRPDGQIRVKILDFGISKLPKEMGGETLTEMGQSLGTFSFMPPEQIGKAKTVDHRADIYACATMIYQAMTGQLPYAARNILVLVEMKSKNAARKLAEATNVPIDPRLEAFVAKGLARDPADRFESAASALAAWRELKTETEPQRPPLSEPRSEPKRAVEPPQPLVRRPPRSLSGTAVMPGNVAAAMRAQAEESGPRELPILHETTSEHEPVVRHVSPSLVLAEATSEDDDGDSAATLAIPLSQLSHHTEMGREHPPSSVSRAPDVWVDMAPPAGSPRGRLSKTIPLQAHSPRAPYPSSHQSQGPAMSRRADDMPQVYDDPSSTAQSQEKTRIYQPNRGRSSLGGGTAVMVNPRPSQPAAMTPRRPEKPRSVVPLIIGAIAFALVGFGAVAMVLGYLKTGSFGLP